MAADAGAPPGGRRSFAATALATYATNLAVALLSLVNVLVMALTAQRRPLRAAAAVALAFVATIVGGLPWLWGRLRALLRPRPPRVGSSPVAAEPNG